MSIEQSLLNISLAHTKSIFVVKQMATVDRKNPNVEKGSRKKNNGGSIYRMPTELFGAMN